MQCYLVCAALHYTARDGSGSRKSCNVITRAVVSVGSVVNVVKVVA